MENLNSVMNVDSEKNWIIDINKAHEVFGHMNDQQLKNTAMRIGLTLKG